MYDLDLKKVDPRLLSRMADHVGSMGGSMGGTFPLHGAPTRGPIAMPMAMPGPGGPGGYNRYREMTLEEMLKDKENLITIRPHCTGQSKDRIREDSERDRFFGAKDSVAYGLVDEILGEDTDTKTAAAAVDANKPK